ncbi:RluA family pseudouridine synthase [Apilactobacillus xinyiensis]|uniref:RluA family pseudouridine synthase n=1 Tax=Apilactobacillus xinyiensis TaxID=2841032 RepID=UPI001C7DE635|nr:RluA family pseudouridine synthase [Apilactobacillus xinyiensis]
MQFTFLNDKDETYGLKKFLNNHGISHRMYNELKNSGEILINQRPLTSDGKIHPKDVVKVTFPDEGSDDNVPISNNPLEVVYEDSNWLVVNKPAGLTSVPGPSNRDDTLVNRVKGYLKKHGSNDLKPHIITRLDRFTSGLVLIAKHRLANSLANQQLANHQIQKQYLAVISGNLDNNHGIIDEPIGQVNNEFRRQVIPDGKPSVTEYWVQKNLNHKALVKVELHTGRTHQIRVHFTYLKHPLLGDQLYNGPLDKGIERQALHAYYLKFYDAFSNQYLAFKAALPIDMQQIVE